MGGTIEFHGRDAGFGPLRRALASRGVAVHMQDGRGLPHLRAGSATIHWQLPDDADLRAAALEQGAADIVGPWMPEREAMARLLRHLSAREQELRIVRGDLVIGLVDRRVARAGRQIALLAREYALLLDLARRDGEPASRAELLKAVWRLDHDPGTNSLEVHMSRLRAKIDRGFASPMLRTVKGQGYALLAT